MTTARRQHVYTGPTDYRVLDVLKVVDGDTVDLRVDLGLHLSAALRFRLLGIDTPDGTREVEAPARDYVVNWLEEAAAYDLEIRVRTHKGDAFGRWLGEVYLRDDTGDVVASLEADLLTAGLAIPYRR